MYITFLSVLHNVTNIELFFVLLVEDQGITVRNNIFCFHPIIIVYIIFIVLVGCFFFPSSSPGHFNL